jgi:transporter family-2 protein
MKPALIPLLIGAIAGISMAVQGSLNTLLSKVIGLLEANFVVHVIGTIALIVLLLFGLGKGNLTHVGEAPWYSYLGGILSIVILYTVMASISKLGVSITPNFNRSESLPMVFSSILVFPEPGELIRLSTKTLLP